GEVGVVDRRHQKCRQARNLITELTYGLEPIDARQLRRDEREIESSSSRKQHFDLAGGVLAGEVRKCRDAAVLEPLRQLACDRAIGLDEQNRRRAIIAEHSGLARRALELRELLFEVDRAPLG